VAHALGFQPERVRIHSTYLGGGFGRRAEHDFVLQAATIARQVGLPVKLIWSREEDFRNDFYRPAAMARLRAARILTEQLALAAAAAELKRLGAGQVADAFIETRLAGQWRGTYGMLDARHDAATIVDMLYPPAG
jgi:CO/xanthine dehydrogenase Mo-binding subunit